MRILLINQFGRSSGAPTGRILAELGAELAKRGHAVDFLVTDSSYGKPRRGIKRLLQEGLSHFLILLRSLVNPRVDAVISLTSPACLAVTAGIAAKLHRARHYHWAMDIYPDVGVRLGEFKDGALIRFFSLLMRRAYQGAHQVIALDEDMRDYLHAVYGVDSAVIEPFPPDVAWPRLSLEPKVNRRWLYSGNFGRAHEIEILLQVQKQLEDRQVPAELILQGQGPQFLSSRDIATRLGVKQVRWLAPVPREKLGESLLDADVLVVTRKVDLKGLLLPSKLILAELSGRSILWIGDTDGKTAQRLANVGRHGVFAPEDAAAIALWLETQFMPSSGANRPDPQTTSHAREQAVDRWASLLARNR